MWYIDWVRTILISYLVLGLDERFVCRPDIGFVCEYPIGYDEL